MESKGKYSQEYLITVHTIYLSPIDAEKLQVKNGDIVEVCSDLTTRSCVYCIVKIDRTLPEGLAYMPYGHVANKLIPAETEACSTPNYKQVRIRVRKADISDEEFSKLIEREVDYVHKVPGFGDRPVKLGEPHIVRDVVCPFCGLLCDNITVKLSGELIIDVSEACVIGRAKFLSYHRDRILKPLKRRENGEFIEVELDRILNEVAELLVNARYPLFYGWSCSTCEAIREGLKLAELVGAVVDNTSSVCHGPTLMAVAETGHSDFTLGFTIHYADTVIFWGWNPAHAHTNFMYRFINPSGKVSKGRQSKRIIVIDVRDVAPGRPRDVDVRRCTGCDLCVEYCPEVVKKVTGRGKIRLPIIVYTFDPVKCRECELCYRLCPTSAIAFERDRDVLLRVKPGTDYELLTAFRMLMRDLEIEKKQIAGIDKETVEKIADLLKKSRYVIIFFGVGLTHSHGKFKNVEEAIKLTHDLNEHTKAIIIAMRGHFNVTGANMVFLWTYGAPFGIDLSKRYPRYIPGVTTAVDILRRGETDLMLVVGTDPAASFPEEAARHMQKIPVILLTPKSCKTLEYANYVIPVAMSGIEVEGTAYRLDGVPIRLRKLVDPPPNVYSDEEILRRLYEKVQRLLRK